VQYHFQLPISIVGVGSISSIERVVGAKGMQPRFFLTPQLIEFKRKTISSMDQRVCSYSSFTIFNPNKEPLEWLIDTAELCQEQIFNILPNEGVLQENQEVTIKATFNPYKAGEFTQFADLFLDGNLKKSHMRIKLKGEGIFPKITFDRREIILPTVPLNVMSKCVIL